jgi:predicted XRE-type DNA-binding protein
MSVEIERVTQARCWEVFKVTNAYVSAVLSGDKKRIKKAYRKLVTMQEKKE